MIRSHRNQVSDVPRLQDGSVRASLRELDGTIVIYLRYCEWSGLMVYAMFSVRVKSDENLVADAVSVWLSRCIFLFVVLDDAFLFAVLNVFPVRLEGYIENTVSLEH